jgi:ankyrin repeat protein
MDKYQIHKAALESDYEYALKLINLKIDLNELDTLGHTPLHWAVFRGDIELVKILLEAGAEPNVFSSDGVTPKWRAQDFGLVEIYELIDYAFNIIKVQKIEAFLHKDNQCSVQLLNKLSFKKSDKADETNPELIGYYYI